MMSAERNVAEGRLTARYRDGAGEALADLDAVRGARLPGEWSLPLPTAQSLDARVVVSSNRVRGRVSLARTRWSFGGPLSWLRGSRPVMGVAIANAAVTFGARVSR